MPWSIMCWTYHLFKYFKLKFKYTLRLSLCKPKRKNGNEFRIYETPFTCSKSVLTMHIVAWKCATQQFIQNTISSPISHGLLCRRSVIITELLKNNSGSRTHSWSDPAKNQGFNTLHYSCSSANFRKLKTKNISTFFYLQ